MLEWTDSHCHLDSIEAPAAEVVAAAREAAVTRIVTIGTDLESSAASVALAESFDEVWASVGIHPHDASGFSAEAERKLVELSGSPKVVAVGETGLDFYRDLSPRDAQRSAFRAQVELAKRLDRALVVHIRDAHDEVFALLENAGPPERLVFHCFSGGPAQARRALDLGGCLSFAGNVSFKSAEALRDAARIAPRERILVETDSPYLAPLPHRGKPNRPAWLPDVGAALAAARGTRVEEIAAVSSENARRIFLLP